jgi:L-ascorbate metabolism protein UlaG (beta-lactamase superfamily)
MRMRALASIAVAAVAIGCAPAREYLQSPEWRGGRFEYPDDWPRRPGVGAFLKWVFGGRAFPSQEFRGPYRENDGVLLRANRDRPSVTWIGHATTLVQGGGISILTDPIFGERISVLFARKAPPGVALEKLPPIDAVLISHSHRDHLDEDSVRAVAAKSPGVEFIVPLGLADWFRRCGISRVVELDWWQSTEIGGRATVTMVPAQHWSRRGLLDENRSLWGGYVIDAGGMRLYFAGDTGYPAAFKEIGKRFPHIDFALLPIGAYEPRWFMHSQHLSPEEAARAFGELGADTLVPMHWGTFQLSDEPMDEPPALLYRAMGRRANRILFLPIGGSYFAPAASSTR